MLAWTSYMHAGALSVAGNDPDRLQILVNAIEEYRKPSVSSLCPSASLLPPRLPHPLLSRSAAAYPRGPFAQSLQVGAGRGSVIFSAYACVHFLHMRRRRGSLLACSLCTVRAGEI